MCFFCTHTGHPLPLSPIGTIFASNWSRHYELHEDVLKYFLVTLCANWQGFKLTMTTKTRPTSPTTWSFHSIFCNGIRLLQGLHTTKNHVIGMVGGCEDFVVKSGVHAVGNQTCVPLLAVFELRCSQKYYIWVLTLKAASSGAHTQFTFQKWPLLGPQLTPSAILQLFLCFDHLCRCTHAHTHTPLRCCANDRKLNTPATMSNQTTYDNWPRSRKEIWW